MVRYGFVERVDSQSILVVTNLVLHVHLMHMHQDDAFHQFHAFHDALLHIHQSCTQYTAFN